MLFEKRECITGKIVIQKFQKVEKSELLESADFRTTL